MTFQLAQARDALARTPSVLRALVAGLPPDWLAATPAVGEWSAHQVACHLAYVEETDWMVRAHMIREVGAERPFPPVDHGDQTERYAGMETDAVVEKIRATPIHDAIIPDGKILANGSVVHDVFLAEVKSPEESKGEWDYYKILRTIPGDQAFLSAEDSGCKLGS